jgi:hypothetical protein
MLRAIGMRIKGPTAMATMSMIMEKYALDWLITTVASIDDEDE